MEMIKELAPNDKAYRSLTNWFSNSPLFEKLKCAELGFKLIITTDHGTINVKNPTKIMAIEILVRIWGIKLVEVLQVVKDNLIYNNPLFCFPKPQ